MAPALTRLCERASAGAVSGGLGGVELLVAADRERGHRLPHQALVVDRRQQPGGRREVVGWAA